MWPEYSKRWLRIFRPELAVRQHVASGSFAGDEVLHLAHPFYAIGMIARRTELLSRFPLQPVNDVFEGLEAAAAGRAGISIYAQLFVRARAVLENVVGTTHLIKASEGLGVISDQLINSWRTMSIGIACIDCRSTKVDDVP